MIKVKTDCNDCIHAKVCGHKGNVKMFYDRFKNENFGKGPNDDYDWVTMSEVYSVNIDIYCPYFNGGTIVR